MCKFVYVCQLLALCVLGCNQQHSLCGLLCSLIGVLANNRGREESVFLFLRLVLQPGLRGGDEEGSLWFGAALRALVLYTSATSDLSLIYMYIYIYLSVSLPHCVSQ